MVDAGLISAFIRGVTPPKLQGVCAWMEDEYYLPAESAAEPGLISLKRTPYQYGIGEAFDDPKIELISLMLAAQTGKTSIILGVMGQVAATPGMGAPILVLMPTISNAEMLAKERFSPMIEASPNIKKGLMDNKKAGTGQTMLQKRFSNGTIVNFVGTNAPGELASRPIKFLLADEVDRFALSAGKEGSPLELAKKRTNSFRGNGRKILVTSTPTLAGASEIQRHWDASDQRKFFVQCPHCYDEHVMEFDTIEWDDDDHTTARYPCPACGTCWSEADRLKAVSSGKWVVTRPEVKGHAGFQCNALVSPWVGQFDYAVKEYLESRGKPELERVFTNTYLGEPFSSDDLALEESQIIDRMAEFGLDLIPEQVLAITGGVDIQRDRIELTTVGWSEHQIYILSHELIYGDTTGQRVWADLREALGRKFQHTLGNKIGYDAAAIDSGYLTQTVMDFAVDNSHMGVFAIKGVAGERLIWEKSKQKRKGSEKLFLVGVDDAKTQIMERLKKDDDTAVGYVHIADQGVYAAEFAKQLISEYRDITFVANRPVLKWTRKSTGHRAEVLDCLVYALAVRSTLKPNWATRRRNLTRVVSDEEETNDWHTF